MAPSHVRVLLLGAGWTATYLLPQLEARNVSYAYTSRTLGKRHEASRIDVDPIHFVLAEDHNHFSNLPRADYIVIMFPLRSEMMVKKLMEGFESCMEKRFKGERLSFHWISLGSTGAWGKGEIIDPNTTPILSTNSRAQSESFLLSLHSPSVLPNARSCIVLNLAGLWGGPRQPRNFAIKVVDGSMEKLESKTSVHLVHGKDVAKAIMGLVDGKGREEMWGKRWIITDTHVYDWWHLLLTLDPPPLPQGKEWVKSLLDKHAIKSLPRAISQSKEESPPQFLDRALEGRIFWEAIGEKPSIGRCDEKQEHREAL